MTSLTLTLSFLILGLGPLRALAAGECKTQRGLTLAQMIATSEMETKLVPEIDILAGTVGAGYEYEVDPAFTDGLYFRTDRWQLAASLTPNKEWDLTEGLKADLKIGPEYQMEATFIRIFDDPCKAELSPPYNFKNRSPIKSSVAMGPNFNVRDYFLLQGSLGFVANTELLEMIGSSNWGAYVGAEFLMKGEYQLHIVKLAPTKIRLKIIGRRERSADGYVGIGYKAPVEVFRIAGLNKQLKKLIAEPFKFNLHAGNDKVMMVDYILDLSHPEVASAFDSIGKKLKFFATVREISSPFTSDADLQESLILDLSPLEDLYQQDFQNGRTDRIKRNLRASSQQTEYGMSLDLGNKIIGLKADSHLSTTRMSVRRPDDKVDHYLMRSWDDLSSGRFLFSWTRRSKEDGMRSLFSADKDFNVNKTVNLVQYYNMKRNRFFYSDYMKVREYLRKSLPADLESKIPWENWTQAPTVKYFTNFGMRYQIFMSRAIVAGAPNLKMEEIKTLFYDHIKGKGLDSSDFFIDMRSGDTDAVISSGKTRFKTAVNEIARKMELAMNSELPESERLDAFTSLRNNEVFKVSGFSFMLAVRPELLNRGLYLDLNLSANESQLHFTLGNPQISTLYKKLLTIKAALDNEAYDILREAESINTGEDQGP